MAKKSDKKKEELKPELEATISATEFVDFEKIQSTTQPVVPVVPEVTQRQESLGEKNKRERLERKGK